MVFLAQEFRGGDVVAADGDAAPRFQCDRAGEPGLLRQFAAGQYIRAEVLRKCRQIGAAMRPPPAHQGYTAYAASKVPCSCVMQKGARRFDQFIIDLADARRDFLGA